MNTPKRDLEYIAEKFNLYWLDLTDAIKSDNWSQVDLLCRRMTADINVAKDLAYELSKLPVLKAI